MSIELMTSARLPVRRRIILAAAIVLGGLIVLGIYRFYGTRVFINQDQVCIQPPVPGSAVIRFSIGGVGCYSSSCTEVFWRRGDLKVDLENHALRLSSIFVVRPRIEAERACTADCGGAGVIWFELQSLPAGSYAIWLGDQKLGDLQVPLSPDQFVCLSASAPSTATPAPSPVPLYTALPYAVASASPRPVTPYPAP
jgi:hypothetical protein